MNESTNPSAIRSKKQITDALIRLMETHPYREITVKQIVLEADVVRKTFYRNFTSKDDVLDSILSALILEYSTELVTTKEKSPLEVIFGFCAAKRDIVMLLDRNDLMYLVLKKLNDAIPGRHDELVRMGLVPAALFGDGDPYYIIAFNVGSIWNVICRWVREGMQKDPKQIVSDLREYLYRIGRLENSFARKQV